MRVYGEIFYRQHFPAVIDDHFMTCQITDSGNNLYRLCKQLLYKADNIL